MNVHEILSNAIYVNIKGLGIVRFCLLFSHPCHRFLLGTF